MNATAFVLARAGPMQLAYSAGYGITLALSIVCVAYLRRHRSSAYTGDEDATRKVILPAFEPLFWVLCAIATPYTIYFLWALFHTRHAATHLSQVLTEVLLQGRQCIVYVVTIFLHQTNVSCRALCRATSLGVALAIAPVAMSAVFSHFDPAQLPAVTSPSCYYSLVVYRSGIVFYFLYLLRWPMSRANPRVIRWFCVYILGFHALVLASMTLFFHGHVTIACPTVLASALYSSVTPVWIWRLLLADTQYWRGLANLGDAPCSMDEAVSAKGFHDLLDAHRDCVIDFAHLKLQHKIGPCVYRGQLHSRYAVAVKVYSPTEITESTLAVFSQETARCATLKHPNVVTFYGMCIAPPMVCLVTELCRCSLDAFLSATHNPVRDPLLQQLALMLDAARALAYLHSFSPPFLHRDVKPGNFLLDDSHVLKLRDFSATRRLAPRDAEALPEPGAPLVMTMQGTVEYMAPEVIGGERGLAAYCESADVFGLGVVFWDILHPGREKYPDAYGNTFRIFELVLAGHRPAIQAETHPVVQDLIESAWGAEPAFRPTAAAIVRALEVLQGVVGAGAALDLYRSPRCELLRFHGASRPKLAVGISGNAVVDVLHEAHYARSVPEAVRIGHVLMDAGFLHHVTHHRGMEPTADEVYMFETSDAPLDCIGEDVSTNGAPPRAPHPRGTSSCGCRGYAQGFGEPRRHRRRSILDYTQPQPRTRKSLVPMLTVQQGDPSRLSTDSVAIALLDDP
ncbi:protein kinase [Achlya hypogyna]|uniref:Protein kinase n=1 Tax=Achlya hypogyna TaxID=1202772 RepID=A0A1V9ZDU2_ACHHY|nr:protein kinase [Achlya hypogyna]